MIGHLTGKPVFMEKQNELIVDVRGVGYSLLCSSNTIDHVSEMASCSIWVHTHVREDCIQLYGFASMAEKELFLALVKVNGIGPKLAIGILSSMPMESLIRLIDEGDIKALIKLPKVGKKTAEQIVLSLKGKMVVDQISSKDFAAKKDIVSALVNLGFKLADVEFVVSKFDDDITVQDGVRQALSDLSG